MYLITNCTVLSSELFIFYNFTYSPNFDESDLLLFILYFFFDEIETPTLRCSNIKSYNKVSECIKYWRLDFQYNIILTNNLITKLYINLNSQHFHKILHVAEGKQKLGNLSHSYQIISKCYMQSINLIHSDMFM